MLVRKIAVKLFGEKNVTILYLKLLHRNRIINMENPPRQLTEKTKKRWLQSIPDAHLTWGINLSGDSFIDMVNIHGKILEIGPGAGRLLTSILKKDLTFVSYTGLDVSGKNIKFLKEKFPSPKIEFIQGDAENALFDKKFDVIISSLTFKHMYPTFEKALINISKYLAGTLYFDLIEGNLSYVQPDDTYIKYYTKNEVKKIINNSNLKLQGFDKVVHSPSKTRMLVIVTKRIGKIYNS